MTELKKVLSDIGTSEYKKKVLLFSKGIERWHQEQSKLNTGVFENDRDFVELDRSPSKFDNILSDSDGEENIDEYLLGSAEQKQGKSTYEAKAADNEASSPTDISAMRASTDEGYKPRSPGLKKGKGAHLTSKKNSSPTTNQKSKLNKQRNKPTGLFIKMRNLSPTNVDEQSKDEPISIIMSPTRLDKANLLAKEAKLQQLQQSAQQQQQ